MAVSALATIESIAVVVAALVSAYAVFLTERDRRFDLQRGQAERLLEAVKELAVAALRVQEEQGRRAEYEAAKIRLGAALELVGVERFPQTDLMVRETPSIGPAEVLRQSEASIVEIGERLNELAPRPLLRLPS